jgi:hypothetical protein
MAGVARVALLVAVLVALAIAGIACLVSPDWGIKHFGSIHLRAGGDLRREWNRVQVQLVGGVITAFVLYLVFHIVHG